MPNWCYNQTTFLSKNKDELTRFHQLIIDTVNMKKSRVDNHFDSKEGGSTYWLGNIVDAVGKDWNKVPCRGEIEDIEEAIQKV